MLLEAHRKGFQVAIHAVQEKLIEAVVSSYEYVKSQTTDFASRRHRIEHCAEGTPHLLSRIKKLGVIVTTHPASTYYSGDRYLATVEPEVLPHVYNLKSLAESGLVIAGASDSPVFPANPLMGIYSAVTRRTSSGQEMAPEQSVTASRVLSFYTINSAYASHEDHIKGSITPGKWQIWSCSLPTLPLLKMKKSKTSILK